MNNIKTNVLFFVLAALIFMAFVTISFFQPNDFIAWLIQHDGWSAEKKSLIEQYVQEEAWFKVKVALAFVFFCLVYLVIFDRDLLKDYRYSFSSFIHWIKSDFMACPVRERIILSIMLFFYCLAMIYYCIITPFQLDELHTWLFFVDKGPLITAAYYPSSNNHIAYNLLSIGWNVFLSPLWAIRIVSMISSMGVIGLFFLILRRRYNALFSFSGILLLMCSAPFLWYAVQGRGYVFELLVLLIVLYIVIRPTYDFVTDRLLILCNAWAIYIVPIAIIPIAMLNAYYGYRLIKEQEQIRNRIFRISIYSIVLIVVCYSPIIIFSGVKQLFNNSFVERIPYSQTLTEGIFKYLPGLWNFISGCGGFLALFVLIILVGGSILLLWSRNTFILWSVGALMIPFLLLQCYPVLLFERTWLWLVIPFVCCLLEIAQFFVQHGKNWINLISISFFLLIASANIVRSYTTNQLLVDHADQFVVLKRKINSRLKGKTIRVYDDVVYDYLLFDQRQHATYTLLYSDQQPALKADAIFMDYSSFMPSDGTVLWTDQKQVLFLSQ